MIKKPKFEQGELHTPAMARLIEHLKERREVHRRSNDRDHDEIKTANLRGQIKEATYLLTLLNAEPAQATDAAE